MPIVEVTLFYAFSMGVHWIFLLQNQRNFNELKGDVKQLKGDVKQLKDDVKQLKANQLTMQRSLNRIEDMLRDIQTSNQGS